MNLRPILAAILLATGVSHADEEKRSDPMVGTLNSEGIVILHVFDDGHGGKRNATLTTDYGIVMCRRPDGWVLFALGDRAKRSVQEFSNYDKYIEAIAALPKGSTLTIYDRCLMPRFYDFYPVHYELYKKFKKDCNKKGLKIAADPRITCTCEEAPKAPEVEKK